ncbi:hypothetical protein Tco_0786871 [Tanacetum coccineum]
MLVARSYVQWKSRIRRYITTRLNHDLINHCVDHGPYEFKMVDHPAKVATEIFEAQLARRGLETYSFMSAKTQKLIDAEAEAVIALTSKMWKLIYSGYLGNSHHGMNGQRFVKTIKQGQDLKEVSYHKLFDILKQHQNEVNEIRAQRLPRNANPLALVATTQQ